LKFFVNFRNLNTRHRTHDSLLLNNFRCFLTVTDTRLSRVTHTYVIWAWIGT